ncbi:MAG: cation:proton antiporter [Candidatus Bathyarchaeia archaeon]|jgi:CPA2 family monovalent cation:H+ antiporter-2
MSFEIQIITDLSVLLVISAVVALIFYKLKQPIVIGYLIAGIIIGPYTPPFSLVSHVEILNVFAEIGVILLLFTIGLEFPISKLRSIGRVVIGVSAIEISLMLIVSWILGNALGWSFYDTLFLGAALASSSTTIISKVLSDMGKIKETPSIIMLGILVVEDITVVVMLAMFQNVAIANTFSLTSSLVLLLKLVAFIGGTLLIGSMLVPKVIDRIAKIGNNELLYILMLGICFAFSIMANQLGFSAAIGAFLIGVVVAKARCREQINREIEPLQYIFGAIFFVSMGALMDVNQISVYWLPALLVTFAVLGTKLVTCGLGTRLFGYDNKTSLRVGLGMAQIGEFAFIVVKAGQDLGVISDFLLPIVAVATIITSFATPYLIKFAFKPRGPEITAKTVTAKALEQV